MRRITLLLAILALSIGAFAAESPFSGTWKLNLAKSKLTPPAPQSDIATIDADDNGMKFSEEVIDEKELKDISFCGHNKKPGNTRVSWRLKVGREAQAILPCLRRIGGQCAKSRLSKVLNFEGKAGLLF